MTPPAVVVVGDAILDVQARPAMPIELGADVPAAINVGPGGQGANLAVRLARQGLDVTLVCAMADDSAGSILRAALAADGVALVAEPADATGLVVVLNTDGGERSMLSQRATISPADAPRLPDAWLVVSGYLLLQQDGPTLASRLAEQPWRRVLVGCAVPDNLVAHWRAGLDALRPDLVVANRSEADRLLADVDLPGLAVTESSGAEARVGEVAAGADVAPGPPAVDTTGAGDAFAAAFLAELLGAEWPPGQDVLQAAVERGVALAADVARQSGAQARVAGERPAMLGR